MSSSFASASPAPTPAPGGTSTPHIAARTLRVLVEGGETHPGAFDAVADEHAELWAPATLLAALARIAGDGGDPDAATQLRQVADHPTDALASEVTGHLPATTRVVATRVALASASRLDSDVLALTHGVDLVDDLTALLLVYRATALARVGMVAAARATFGRVLRSRRVHPAIRTFARGQRDVAWSTDDVASDDVASSPDGHIWD